MKQENIKIGIDLDDTFWDLLVAWINRYNQNADDNLKPSDIRTWDIKRYVKDGYTNYLFSILEDPSFWKTVNPKPRSVYFMQKLLEEHHELYIVTATASQTAYMKMMRFFELCPFMKEEQIILTGKKQLIDVDVLVDDYPKNLIGGKYKKLLFDAPHNWDYDETTIDAKRCHNWAEVYKEINQIALTIKGGIC